MTYEYDLDRIARTNTYHKMKRLWKIKLVKKKLLAKCFPSSKKKCYNFYSLNIFKIRIRLVFAA